MKVDAQLDLVSKEAKRHIDVFHGAKDSEYIQSALEEFFWGTYDELTKARKRKQPKRGQ